jgi:hypothetical protein
MSADTIEALECLANSVTDLAAFRIQLDTIERKLAEIRIPAA